MSEFQLEGEFETLKAVQEGKEKEVLDKPNVVGFALGTKIKREQDTGDPCLTVFVSQKLAPALLGAGDKVATTMEKFKTDVVETGDFFAGTAPPLTRILPGRFVRGRKAVVPYPPPPVAEAPAADGVLGEVAPVTEPELYPELFEEVGIEVLRSRVRPVEGGYSIGHYRVTAGTMATAVYDSTPYPGLPSRYYILSNNHVLANSNVARVGDPILQPGRVDGGSLPGDVIGRLSRFVPIRFGGPANYVDAAIAEAPFHDIDREVYWIGYVKGVRFLNRIGDIVQKTGRTTNYTTGRVTNINATVNVNYGSGRVARMVRQIVTTDMSRGGDSGSLLCDLNENAVGLLFAGSATRTIHNDIMYVQNLLRIRIV